MFCLFEYLPNQNIAFLSTLHLWIALAHFCLDDTSNRSKTSGHSLLCELRFVKNMLQKSSLLGQEVYGAIMSKSTLL